MPQVASCMFMCLPALSCTVVHRERGKEGGKRGEGGGKEEKKIRPPGPPREGLLEEFEIKDQGTGAVLPILSYCSDALPGL